MVSVAIAGDRSVSHRSTHHRADSEPPSPQAISLNTPWGTCRLDDRDTGDSLFAAARGLTLELDHPAEQIERLQRCISDLVALVALPASWAGADPTLIGGTLVQTLAGVLPPAPPLLRAASPPPP